MASRIMKLPRFLKVFTGVLLAMAALWYFLLYPGELWIRYNLAFQPASHEAFADYVQNQNDFEKYRCEHGRVYLDEYRPAASAIESVLLKHCESTGLTLGRRVEFGAWFYTGSLRKWRDDYDISILRLTNIPEDTTCARIPNLGPNEDCIFVIDDRWVMHFWRAADYKEEAEGSAEDVARHLQEKERSSP